MKCWIGCVVLWAVLAVSAADNSDYHVLVATYHHTGHTVPMMALAKGLKDRGFQVSMASLEAGRGQMEENMKRVGVEFIAAGSFPWSVKEDQLWTAEMFDNPNFLEVMPKMKKIFMTYEEQHYLGLEEHFKDKPLPDHMVIDMMNFGGADFAVKHNIPYTAVHTSGLPMFDQWNTFFVPFPSHHGVLFFPRDDLTSSLDRILNNFLTHFMEKFMASMFTGTSAVVRERIGVPLGNTPHRFRDLPVPVILCSELIQWLDEAVEQNIPVVLLSTGSNARFPADELAVVVEALETLPYRVIWSARRNKYPVMPVVEGEHVKILDFVPQVQILRHEATKVFVSHCGQNSMLESIKYHVPVLGIPFIGDQPGNARRLAKEGAGLVIDRTTMTSKDLQEAITAVIEKHDQYREGMVRLDHLLAHAGGIPKAAEFIEIGVKYGYGHLYPLNLSAPWYQFYELDIYLGWALLVAIILGIMYAMLKLVCCCCCKRKRGGKSKSD